MLLWRVHGNDRECCYGGFTGMTVRCCYGGYTGMTVRCCYGGLGVVMAGEVLLWRVRCCYGG